jgi:surface protein
MEHMFRGCNFNGDISNWDVSNVIDMESMFQDSRFNGDISNWDVSRVQNMSHMFHDSDFNKDISQWNTCNVINMSIMFYRSKFEGDISNWDVSRVVDMEGMFGESSFNGDISHWKTYSLEKVKDMFYKSKFNGDISQWDLSLILNKKHTLSMGNSKRYKNCYYYYEEYIKNGPPSEYDYFELTNEFILSKLLNVDCSINMNIIEHSHKVHSMIDILWQSIILMDIKECARLYNIPNEFIKHHVETRVSPIFEDLCEGGGIDELVTKISKIDINDLKKEIDNNALLGR